MDACLAKLDAYVAGGGIVHQSLLALQRAPIVSNSRWRLQKVCDLAQVVKVGGALMARCRVSDSLRHDMELRHDTLKGVERVLKELVVLVKQDLEIRFANTGILRHLYILDPMWDGDSRPALLAWQSHFATPAGRLEAQFDDIAAAKKAYVISNPATINSAAHEFWPPLLSAHRAHAPELCRCMAAMISMSWQNAVVERDIAIVKRVSDVAHGSLQHERLDSRCRIVVDGECEGNPAASGLAVLWGRWRRSGAGGSAGSDPQRCLVSEVYRAMCHCVGCGAGLAPSSKSSGRKLPL